MSDVEQYVCSLSWQGWSISSQSQSGWRGLVHRHGENSHFCPHCRRGDHGELVYTGPFRLDKDAAITDAADWCKKNIGTDDKVYLAK